MAGGDGQKSLLHPVCASFLALRAKFELARLEKFQNICTKNCPFKPNRMWQTVRQNRLQFSGLAPGAPGTPLHASARASHISKATSQIPPGANSLAWGRLCSKHSFSPTSNQKQSLIFSAMAAWVERGGTEESTQCVPLSLLSEPSSNWQGFEKSKTFADFQAKQNVANCPAEQAAIFRIDHRDSWKTVAGKGQGIPHFQDCCSNPTVASSLAWSCPAPFSQTSHQNRMGFSGLRQEMCRREAHKEEPTFPILQVFSDSS
jgi:hypothetical protein